MPENIPLILLPALVVVAALAVYSSSGKKLKQNRTPLPPGPRGLPLVGNIADFPTSESWVTFAEWGEKYGPIVYINVLGMSMVILNDSKVAMEMLDRKRKIYSERPTSVMAGELVGWAETPAMLQFDRNGPWSDHRRSYAHYMGSRGKVANYFSDILQEGVHDILKRLSDSPSNWAHHVEMYGASNVLRFAYGYKVNREDDNLLSIVTKAMSEFVTLASFNSASLVDIFPIFRYTPSWFPGASWKRKLPAYKANYDRMVDAPFEWSEQQLNGGNENSSFVHASLVDGGGLTPAQIHHIKVTAASIYGGGAETTTAGITSFFLAMTYFPSAQAKAQAEIDKVIGSERLPTLNDRPQLPYVEALFWEVLRFYPFVPLAIPHATHEDDIHDGYFIPKGSMVIPNVWKFMRDRDTYHHPDVFSPERFLPTDGNAPEEDPRNYVFGFGSRVCPGKHLGDASVWLAITSILSTFNISPPLKDGKPVLPNIRYTEVTVLRLEPFECLIKPRGTSGYLMGNWSEISSFSLK